MNSGAGTSSRERILTAATRIAQAHGYGGLNFRDLAADVGIKAASIYHHFASKAELAAAVARRYWEDSAAELDTLSPPRMAPMDGLRHYPATFRRALENGNRLCLCSYMAAESDDLPEIVMAEVKTFADVHVRWLGNMLTAAGVTPADEAQARAGIIFAAVAGAQLIARSRADLALYDQLIGSYRLAGPLPA
ncbi:TetR/AcrR family transcriptional regulator [Frateuria aurantia]